MAKAKKKNVTTKVQAQPAPSADWFWLVFGVVLILMGRSTTNTEIVDWGTIAWFVFGGMVLGVFINKMANRNKN